MLGYEDVASVNVIGAVLRLSVNSGLSISPVRWSEPW